jgi:hypothetical protein
MAATTQDLRACGGALLPRHGDSRRISNGQRFSRSVEIADAASELLRDIFEEDKRGEEWKTFRSGCRLKEEL